jgi:opacity protein-like surface antigen
MKSTILVALIVLIALTVVSAEAKTDLGFNSIGVKVGYLKPEDPIDGTIGFGAQANFGTITTNVALDGFVEYWSKKYDLGFGYDASFSEFVIGAMLKYYFPMNSSLKPYVGAGLAMHFGSAKTDVPNYFGGGTTSVSATSSDIGVPIVGGAELNLSPKLNGFGEVKYAATDLSYFGIFVGVNYLFGK